MSRHLEQVLAHAENQLAAMGARRPTEVLPLYKKFLKVEEHRLRLKHQAGGGGREICARRAELVDVLLQYVFGATATATRGNGTSWTPLTLIALGGYRRSKLNPFSDIDVMLLHHQGTRTISPHLVEMRMQDQVARHKKFGDSVYLQEPHVKSGCGGLSDYQNLLWMTYFKEGSISTN